jgi:hypothetical protein
MKTIFSIIAFFFTAALVAQENKETRPVGDFTGIKTSSVIQVEITQGEACAVRVDGPAEDMNEVKTEVEKGVLIISTNGHDYPEDVVVKVTVKNLRTLETSGASNITSANKIVSDSLQITSSGASVIKLDVQANHIKANLTGASSLKLSGVAGNVEGVLAGAAQLKAYELAAGNVTLATTGASSAHVTVSSALNATSSGASEIHYQGNPVVKSVSASDGSSIKMKDGNSSASDTTSFHMGKYDVHVTENEDGDGDERSKREKHANDNDFKYWRGIDFGVNGLLTAQNSVELPAGFEFLELNYAKSYFFSLNFFQKNIHIYRNNVNLGTGLGFSWYHYNFRNPYTLTPNVNYQTATYDSTIKYSRNRLGLTYLNVPLFLEFNTNSKDAKNSFHIAGGMEFGYNVFTNLLKQKYEIDGHKIKTKQEDDFNINPFRYDVIARVGYGDFTIFGKYSLSTLFEKGKGPVLYPFTAGLSLNF